MNLTCKYETKISLHVYLLVEMKQMMQMQMMLDLLVVLRLGGAGIIDVGARGRILYILLKRLHFLIYFRTFKTIIC